MAVTVVDDYVAEAMRLEGILALLTEAQWLTQSGADGWSIADVVLHTSRHQPAAARRMARAPDAAVRALAGRRRAGRGALLADRAGWRDHLDLRAG